MSEDSEGNYSYDVKEGNGNVYEGVKEDDLKPDKSKYPNGQSVWYKISEGQFAPMTVAAKAMDSGDKVSYQIKDDKGKLHGDGKWVSETALNPR